MSNRLSWIVVMTVTMCATPAFAQEHHAEFTVLAGWAWSEGVNGDPVTTGDGNVYDRVDPKSAFKWGFSAGFFANEETEVGFRFGRQLSTLRAKGTTTTDVGDMTVDTYHGYFAYNIGDASDAIRPYIMGGLGGTHFGPVDYTRRNGQPGTIGGITRFSTTWGGGVKVYASPNLGAQFGVQWTPTPVKSDAVGWWCDPFWGCYLAGST